MQLGEEKKKAHMILLDSKVQSGQFVLRIFQCVTEPPKSKSQERLPPWLQNHYQKLQLTDLQQIASPKAFYFYTDGKQTHCSVLFAKWVVKIIHIFLLSSQNQ